MLLFFVIILALIFFTSFYLKRYDMSFAKFIFLFFFFFISTGVIYYKKGNLESFTFENNLVANIENVIKDPEELKKIDPELIILFLEKKLEDNPKDINGWLILARTCVISGYVQKADMYYKTALSYYPQNKNALVEYSILKKNTNQTKSAVKLLSFSKKLYPEDKKIRELLIEILITNKKVTTAIKEINELIEIKKDDQDYVEYVKEKFKLR
ncbi:MAG: hypothetical protein CBC25_02890 [Pelagibacteraceae bacterium TMED65]|nr:hypothetical protein [Rickettsiales bacterium]OUU52493.1 MAG: hypothetical protein CBC25_02890 [Pelagibacteraceae bacterium TMED65]